MLGWIVARQLNKFTARTVATLSRPGRHSDGGGLYLIVDKSGAKRWAFIFRFEGKQREMGLGGVNSVSLARARELAARARSTLASGKNPIDARRTSDIPTFGEMADRVVAMLEHEWRNEKHRAQWRSTLKNYAAPIRAKRVDEITTEHVLSVLKPIWTTKPETASRVRGRIERVLDAARALGHRTGENPARWRGHLKNLLPRRQKLTRGHHAAMPYQEVPAFLVRLRAREAIAALALEFTILTAARTGEVLGARWSEIDMEAALWTLPAARTKAGRDHRVPLSSSTLKILERVMPLRVESDHDGYVFPGQKQDRPLSSMAMDMLLRRMDAKNCTVHGFRSSFRDWAGERTNFPREVAEAALAHVVGDATERAYRRHDALEKRRKLMDAWERFIGSATNTTSNVVAL